MKDSVDEEWFIDMVDSYSAKLRNRKDPFRVVGSNLKIE